MNWSSLPDIFAIAVLICAFASTTRRNYSPSARLWLIGWLMIALHFVAHLFVSFPGVLGFMADFLTTVSLVWAGVLFLSAVNPNRKELFSRWMMVILLVSNTLYTLLITTDHPSRWALTLAASLFGLGPLALYLAAPVLGKNINCRHCLATSVLNLALAVFLLLFQNRPGNGIDLALSAVLVTVYLGCSISFFFSYRRATAGAFITIAGFAVWASVFWLGPTLYYFFPKFQVESEVWNLPKYIVAVGMILLLLEDQIEHNKHLALHDPLTGLPNRRLFEDRLASALDRARRTNTQMVLLIIDLNRFKEVNDHFGHHVGDLLLQRVGAIFSGRVRRSDTVARTGGDEFSIILEEPASRIEAKHVSHALLELLHEPLQLENYTVSIGASIGFAVFPEDASEMEALSIVADKRMYEEKMRLIAKNQPEAVRLSIPLSSSYSDHMNL